MWAWFGWTAVGLVSWWLFLILVATRPWPDTKDGWVLTFEVLARVGGFLPAVIVLATMFFSTLFQLALFTLPEDVMVPGELETIYGIIVLMIASVCAAVYASFSFVIFLRTSVGKVKNVKTKKKLA